MNIPLIKPYISDEVKKKVLEVLDSGYLTEGSVTKEFEDKFKTFIGCKHAISVTSCTTGLEIALRVLGIGEGDEVIVPDYTYPATAAVVAIVGATAVIVDICRDNMLIDYSVLEKAITPKTKAIIPVSIFGNPLDYKKLNEIKKKHNLYIIEDAACSIGGSVANVKIGFEADISVFSLHPRKFITTGEGGMITTDNSKLADWMNSYKHFGMNMKSTDRKAIEFEMIGTNYKLSNILAAVGLIQLNSIDLLLNRRIELAENYYKILSMIPQISFPSKLENAVHTYQSFCVFVENRDLIMRKIREKGIEVQIGTYSLHMHKAFQPSKNIRLFGNFENSRWVFEHCLTLPLFHELTFEDQTRIAFELEETIKSI